MLKDWSIILIVSCIASKVFRTDCMMQIVVSKFPRFLKTLATFIDLRTTLVTGA